MFRLYRFPRNASNNASLEQQRLVARFAARKDSARMESNGKSMRCDQYLVISALPFDIPLGACAALRDGRCGIYEGRPLACRTVPAHYSRAEAAAERDFDEFTQRPGYRCDTGPTAEIILDGGRIVDPGVVEARARAVDLAISDQAWNAAILQRMNATAEEQASLPSLKQIHDNASRGAMTTSMRVAWQIARDSGLLETADYLQALNGQLRLIEREVAMARASGSDLDTLIRMRAEYKHCLQNEGHVRKNVLASGAWAARLRRYWSSGEG